MKKNGTTNHQSNDWHVMPVDDLREHVFDNCPCEPTVLVEGANLIYVHHSWDGRELFEEIEEILNE